MLRAFRIFIATPGDLVEERRALREVVEELNSIYSKETDLRIELLAWEDTLIGAGRPQEHINRDVDRADLFIGCVHQRWGSPSSIASERTGFEEEFDRAMNRHERSGQPEIWQFFKAVLPETLRDPGDQLRKVISFRERLVAEKRVLFAEFSEVNDWRKRLNHDLQRLVVRKLQEKPSTDREQPVAAGTSKADVTERPQTKEQNLRALAAQEQLVKTFDETSRLLREGKLAAIDRSVDIKKITTVRLTLFAAANYNINSQHIEFGVHEMNQVYWFRDGIQLALKRPLFLYVL